MNLQTIHHIAINASNYAATKTFYVDKLGFQIVRENHRLDKGDIKLDLQLGTQELEIFIAADLPARPSYPEALGLRHLAFQVDSVVNTVTELAELGIQCEPIRLDTYTNKPMTFFFDPDHQPLEIHE